MFNWWSLVSDPGLDTTLVIRVIVEVDGWSGGLWQTLGGSFVLGNTDTLNIMFISEGLRKGKKRKTLYVMV